jgi:hypothetical protein
MKKNKKKKTLFNEMLDSGALAAGMGEFGEAEDDFGGPDDDLGGLDDEMGGDEDLSDELEDELDDELGDEGGETVTKTELRDAFENMIDTLFGGDEDLDDLGGLDGLGDEEEDLGGLDGLGDEEEDLGGLDDDMAGLEDDADLDDDPFDECMESIQRIAGMLTDDPDILREERDCPECGKNKISSSKKVSMCRKCDQNLRTPPPPTGGKKGPKKKVEDPDNPPQYKD